MRVDIAIVGGGLAGVSMARALRTYPGRVALIDRHDLSRADAFSPPLRAIALSDGSCRIFASLGVWDAIAPHACAVDRIHVSEHNAFGGTRIDARNEGLDTLGCVVTNVELLRALHRGLGDDRGGASLPEVELLSSTTVTGVRRDDGCVTLALQCADQAQTLSARLLILADGGASSLAQDLGFAQRRLDFHQTALVVAIETARPYDGTVYERFTGGGLLAVLPQDGGSRRVAVWVARTGEFENRGDDILAAATRQQLGGRLGAVSIAGKRFVYPLERCWVAQPAHARVVLLGDAAHRIHPVAGQGFNLSLRDVAFLSEHIAGCDDPGAADVLAAYSRSRAADVRRVVCFTDFLAHAVMWPARSAALARGAGLAVFDALPPLRRAVVRRSLGLSPPYSRLACGMPLR